MRFQSGIWRRVAALLLVAVFAGACNGSATTTLAETTEAESQPQSVDQAGSATEPTAEPTVAPVEPTAVPEPTATPEPTAIPAPEPVYFGSALQIGDCFNRVAGNPSFQPPNVVPCDDLHEEELYAKALLSDPEGTPYPGEDALSQRVSVELCDQATIGFLGATWDAVPVTTFLLYPLEDEWDAGDRNVMCSASSSEDETSKIGTAAGGTIDTDDVLLARAGIASDGEDFDDWIIITQHDGLDAVGSLSDGQFTLPLRRPFPVPQGFVFHAREVGSQDHATTTWGYNWADQEFTDLGSILPGQELASTIIANGAVIFAARATPDDDFDLWTTASGNAELLIGGDGDQRFPTLSPDQSKIVYHDAGDIWVANVDGSDPLQLTSGPANDWESIVSPDGGTVVFASDRSGNDDLWSISIDGGEPVNLTNHPADESWPVFSEDGTHIYFGSDRLVPADDRLVIMVMNADGSNQSWFGNAQSSQATIVPQAIADDVVANTPTLNERYNYDLIEGEPGSTITWTHSNGRLSVDLPAGWRVGEFTDGSGFVAGIRPDSYFDTWSVDGVQVTLWDDQTQDDFFAIVSETEAQTCEQFDGTDGIVPIDEVTVGVSANFNCGVNGAVGGVIAFYNTETGVGVIIEGQRDNQPDADIDSAMLTAIARSLVWE